MQSFTKGIKSMTRDEAVHIMTDDIASILIGYNPTIYLYGSAVLDDFRLGWSDIDILVLTKGEISHERAEVLITLRQDLLKRYPGNLYFRLFEGGMLSVDAFISGGKERTVYWGASGQRITGGYKMDSFGLAQLLDRGVLLHGDDIRDRITYPTYARMRGDIAHHAHLARKYGQVVGWLLDIARGLYTLRTGQIIAKTAAGEWALKNGLCPDTDALQKAIAIRKEPHAYAKEDMAVDNIMIERFADVLDVEFANTIERFARSELQRMNIPCDTLSLIRDKDGVSVWRVATADGSAVMKCFDKQEYRREITNYQLLRSLDVPTLRVIAHTDCAIVLEDIEGSAYRLGTAEDINNPAIAVKIALWYKTLHQKGQKYVNTHDFIDEYDSLTLENLKMVQEKTQTGDLYVWRVIEESFETIRAAVMSLPRTLVNTDFHYSNLAVARDGSSALVFDYNFFFKSYAYSDIRNVCGSFDNEDAKVAFFRTYGAINEDEVSVDDVASVLSALVVACSREIFPKWAKGLLEQVKEGRLLAAVERLLEVV